MSETVRRLNFERGDSAPALLFDARLALLSIDRAVMIRRSRRLALVADCRGRHDRRGRRGRGDPARDSWRRQALRRAHRADRDFSSRRVDRASASFCSARWCRMCACRRGGVSPPSTGHQARACHVRRFLTCLAAGGFATPRRSGGLLAEGQSRAAVAAAVGWAKALAERFTGMPGVPVPPSELTRVAQSCGHGVREACRSGIAVPAPLPTLQFSTF